MDVLVAFLWRAPQLRLYAKPSRLGPNPEDQHKVRPQEPTFKTTFPVAVRPVSAPSAFS
jgi:hypothetical protein